MESWSTEFSEIVQTLMAGVEQFVADLTKDVETTLDAWIDASEEWAEQLETAIAPELDAQISQFLDPILDALLEFGGVVDETVQPVVNTVEPMLNHHPACVGCRNYHGQSYDGVMLVCGLHPYGWEGDTCPDWESFFPNSPE